MNGRRSLGLGLILISILLAIIIPMPRYNPQIGISAVDLWFLLPALVGLIMLAWPGGGRTE